MTINEKRIEKLIALRNHLGLRQKEFAAKFNMNSSFYCRLENGATAISDKTLKKIGMAFNIPEDIMLDDKRDSYVVEREKTMDEDRREEKGTLLESSYKLLNNIIDRGGKNNLGYIKEVNQFLLEVQYFLDYKDQFHDLYENEDKVLDAGANVIGTLMNL